MREIKSELVGAKERSIVVLTDTPQHQGLVKANRFLLLVASSLMVVVFVLGFFLLPSDDMLDNFNAKQEAIPAAYALQNPVLSAEINTLKGQLVGLVSGSIESKLRTLEESIRNGSVNTSLGTIQDLKNDVKVLRSYSVPEKRVMQSQANEALLKEVSQLKSLIYLTLTSCGLMIAAIGGFWVRNHYRLVHPHSLSRAELGKHR
ncbi:MAG: hypothetical protein KAR12_00890 [Methylococcales bacterium]|nr:hypothetical protein [Methylococcales bacterium]